MSARPAGWNPAADPTHRLVLLLDVFAAAAARFRTAVTAAGDALPFRQIERLYAELDEVAGAAFPPAAGRPAAPDDLDHLLTRLAAGAVARLVGGRGADPEPVVRAAAGWLDRLWGLFTRHDGKLAFSPNAPEFAAQAGLLADYRRVRRELVFALARTGAELPPAVADRPRRAADPDWLPGDPPPSPPLAFDQLLAWLAEADPAADPPAPPPPGPDTLADLGRRLTAAQDRFPARLGFVFASAPDADTMAWDGLYRRYGDPRFHRVPPPPPPTDPRFVRINTGTDEPERVTDGELVSPDAFWTCWLLRPAAADPYPEEAVRAFQSLARDACELLGVRTAGLAANGRVHTEPGGYGQLLRWAIDRHPDLCGRQWRTDLTAGGPGVHWAIGPHAGAGRWRVDAPCVFQFVGQALRAYSHTLAPSTGVTIERPPVVTPAAPVPATDPTPAQPLRRQVPRGEAEVRVREYLAEHARADPAAVTRDRVAAATGVSGGAVSQTAAWKAFADRRAKVTAGAVRTVPLTDALLAALPDHAAAGADELAALIADQADDQRADDEAYQTWSDRKRRHARGRGGRHGPS